MTTLSPTASESSLVLHEFYLDTASFSPSLPPYDGAHAGESKLNKDDIERLVRAGDDRKLKACLEQMQRNKEGNAHKLVQDRYKGETLLTLAARCGHHEVGATLLRYGANPSLGREIVPESESFRQAQERIRDDKNVSTPMYWAALGGHYKFVELLFDAGVNNDDVLAAFLTNVDLRVATITASRSKVDEAAMRSIVHTWLATEDGHVAAGRLLYTMRDVATLADTAGMVIAAGALQAQSVKLLFDFHIRASSYIGLGDVGTEVTRDRVRISDFRVWPMDVAIGRSGSLTEAQRPKLRETLQALITAGGSLKADHLKHLVAIDDRLTFGLGLSLSKKLDERVLESAVDLGELYKVAMILERHIPSIKEFDQRMVQAQDRGFAATYNLLSAAKSYFALKNNHSAAQVSWVQSWRSSLYNGPAQPPSYATLGKVLEPVQPHTTALNLARDRFGLLMQDALNATRREQKDPSMPPPRGENRNRYLVLFGRSA